MIIFPDCMHPIVAPCNFMMLNYKNVIFFFFFFKFISWEFYHQNSTCKPALQFSFSQFVSTLGRTERDSSPLPWLLDSDNFWQLLTSILTPRVPVTKFTSTCSIPQISSLGQKHASTMDKDGWWQWLNNYSIDDTEEKEVSTLKILGTGITVDQNLTWKNHACW